MSARTVDVTITADTSGLRAALDALAAGYKLFWCAYLRVHGSVPYRRNAGRYGR